MAPHRLFLSTDAIDAWVTSGAVDITHGQLRVRSSGAAFAIEEAAHVVAEVTGTGDAPGLVGCVRSAAELTAAGAELLDRSLVFGELAYDVVPGFLASPLGRTGGRVRSRDALRSLPSPSAGPGPTRTDEELLARYLMEKL